MQSSAHIGKIMVETKDAAELSALSAYDLGVALNEIIEATAECRRFLLGARRRSMDAKLSLLTSSVPADREIAKADRIIAETDIANARDRAAALRLSSSILQSLLRAATIV